MIGKTFEFTWPVERGKISELVGAMGDPNPIYRDAVQAQKEGYSNIVAPPTFSTVAVLWTGVLFKVFEELKIPLDRILHAEQSYEYYDPIMAEDTLRGVLEVKAITERQGKVGSMHYVMLETVYNNQCDQKVLKENMLIVERM
jgi:acyl dehydratase